MSIEHKKTPDERMENLLRRLPIGTYKALGGIATLFSAMEVEKALEIAEVEPNDWIFIMPFMLLIVLLPKNVEHDSEARNLLNWALVVLSSLVVALPSYLAWNFIAEMAQMHAGIVLPQVSGDIGRWITLVVSLVVATATESHLEKVLRKDLGQEEDSILPD